MIEEKRIITSKYGTLSRTYPTTSDIAPVWKFTFICEPTPITKAQFKKVVKSKMRFPDAAIVNIIGIDKFWDRYSKPITGKKVPDDQ